MPRSKKKLVPAKETPKRLNRSSEDVIGSPSTRGIFEARNGLLSQILASACSGTNPTGGLPSSHLNCWKMLSCELKPANSTAPSGKLTAVELSCCDFQVRSPPRVHDRTSPWTDCDTAKTHRMANKVEMRAFSMSLSPSIAGLNDLGTPRLPSPTSICRNSKEGTNRSSSFFLRSSTINPPKFAPREGPSHPVRWPLKQSSRDIAKRGAKPCSRHCPAPTPRLTNVYTGFRVAIEGD